MSVADIMSAMQNRISSVGAVFKRNAGLPSSVPSGGLVIMRDGEAGEPEYVLSPLRYYYRHRVDIELFVAKPDSEAVIYGLADAIYNLLRSDRSLGGLVEDIEAGPIEVDAVQTESGAEVLGARQPIYLHYMVVAQI